MATLTELQSKWFLTFSENGTVFPPIQNYDQYTSFLNGQSPFPPLQRRRGNSVSDYTDQNLVTWLIDGEEYMGQWHQMVNQLQSANCELYHSAYRLDQDVRTLGHSNPASDALEVINAADERGVSVYVLLSSHFHSPKYNWPSHAWLLSHGVESFTDYRFPPAGSNHSKYAVFKNPSASYQSRAILGSADLAKKRWDTSDHLPINNTNSNRAPGISPSHEVGVLIDGPAVADIERSFRDRAVGAFELQTSVIVPPTAGLHSVQVLHTYGIQRQLYSPPDEGEFSCWASYLNAIRMASNLIYIEDPYFLPFGYPPVMYEINPSPARDSDIVYQLGEALKRGVNIIVITPRGSEEGPYASPYQVYQRALGFNYLAGIANTAPGRLIVAHLTIFNHSKLMIVDDEFVLVGSSNICRRAMTNDGELHVGIVDGGNAFARQLREELWTEHLQSSITIGLSMDDAFSLFQDAVTNQGGRVRAHSTAHPGDLPDSAYGMGHETWINFIVDPYGGPTPRS